jgi:hypothetical protein
MFHTHLNAARDVPCRMETEPHTVDQDRGACIQGVDPQIGTKPRLQKGFGVISARSTPRQGSMYTSACGQ